jgi:lysine 2,3-aminomutase
VVTQFNHARELTPMAARAGGRLADAGIPLLCQSVLLGGVNDDPDTMEDLLCALLKHRVRPYYLHHPDPVRGTGHFRVSVEKGLEIMAAIRERMSGIGVPQYVADTAGAAGKVPLNANHVPAGCQPGVTAPPEKN